MTTKQFPQVSTGVILLRHSQVRNGITPTALENIKIYVPDNPSAPRERARNLRERFGRARNVFRDPRGNMVGCVVCCPSHPFAGQFAESVRNDPTEIAFALHKRGLDVVDPAELGLELTEQTSYPAMFPLQEQRLDRPYDMTADSIDGDEADCTPEFKKYKKIIERLREKVFGDDEITLNPKVFHLAEQVFGRDESAHLPVSARLVESVFGELPDRVVVELMSEAIFGEAAPARADLLDTVFPAPTF